MKLLYAVGAGLAGALVLTATHQILQKIYEDAPRMDLMGEEAVTKITDKTGTHIPQKNLYGITMAGDIAANTLYYALAAIGKSKKTTLQGTMLGLAAGIGGVFLPKHMRLTNAYSDRTPATRLLTMAIYTLGGFVTGKIADVLHKRY